MVNLIVYLLLESDIYSTKIDAVHVNIDGNENVKFILGIFLTYLFKTNNQLINNMYILSEYLDRSSSYDSTVNHQRLRNTEKYR